MFIILVYDVGSKRDHKVIKVCRKYLSHIQKSVFEGNISERQLKSIQKRLEPLIVPEQDSITIYRIDNIQRVEKYQIGKSLAEGNII